MTQEQAAELGSIQTIARHQRAIRMIDSSLKTAQEKMADFLTTLATATSAGKPTEFLDWAAMEMFQNAGRIAIYTEASRGLNRGLTVEGLRVHLLAQGLAKTLHGSSVARDLNASALRDAAIALYEELAFHV